jgi:CHAD domain-containing protein
MKDEGTLVFSAIIFNRYLEALRQETEGVRQAKDIEYIHRMRVASRRLSSALHAFEDYLPPKKVSAWQKEVRAVTKALGKARDADVQLAVIDQFSQTHPEPAWKAGLRRLTLRLNQKRARYQNGVDSALDSFEQGHTLDELAEHTTRILRRQDRTYLYTPAIYMRAYTAISSGLIDFISYEPFVSQPERIAELHAMRIAAKRLRYNMEIFSPLYPDELKDHLVSMRKFQDQLGSLHDCDVWIAFLPDFITRERQRTLTYFGHLRGFNQVVPGIERFQQDRRDKRAEVYREFFEYWNDQNTQNLLQALLPAVQIPFNRTEGQSSARVDERSAKTAK